MGKELHDGIDEYIRENDIEFIDFGASNDGSMEFAKKHFCKNSSKEGLWD